MFRRCGGEIADHPLPPSRFYVTRTNPRGFVRIASDETIRSTPANPIVRHPAPYEQDPVRGGTTGPVFYAPKPSRLYVRDKTRRGGTKRPLPPLCWWRFGRQRSAHPVHLRRRQSLQ